jgi:hypothetical protein
MLVNFFFHLREHKLPVSIREYLDLLEALEKRVISYSLNDFYYLSRAVLVKDESQYDKFDRAFGTYFEGIVNNEIVSIDIPEAWLRKMAERYLTEEEKTNCFAGWF